MPLTLEELDRRHAPAAVLSLGPGVFVQESTADPTGAGQIFGWVPFGTEYRGLLNTAMVDRQLVAVAPQAGGGPRVQVWARTDHYSYDKVFDEFVFEPDFRGGVNVTLADVNADGAYDLVVGAGPGGGPRVRTYLNTPAGFVPDRDFFAFEDSFRGGVYVEGYRRDLVVAPGPGGGPRVQKYEAGELVADAFVLDPARRDVVDYAYGDVGGRVQLEVLTAAGRLLTYDRDFAPVADVMPYHHFDAIGIGDYVDFDATSVMAAAPSLTGRGMVGAVNSLDELLGVPLSHVDFPAAVGPGHAEIPPAFQGEADAGTYDALAFYRDPAPALFPGLSIGRLTATGTYTLTVRDLATGVPVGLTNQHVVGTEPRIFQPGPAEGFEKRQVGTVLRTSNADVDVGVFSLLAPYDPAFRIGYYDAYLQKDVAVTLPLRYDPAGEILPGAREYKIGRTTGLTRMTVEATDATVTVQYPDTVRTLDHQVVAHGVGAALPGDSGSPVFSVRGGEAWFTGQLFAGSPDHVIFTPAAAVFAAAGVTFIDP